jgi:hypothetical protein
MSSLERLPPDQRAVLALVLQRGRSYDQIAALLAIDRAAVRDRALVALDGLGPSEPHVPPERRALITDYLLGQLPDRVRDDVAARLGSSPSERAWARVLASELAPLATDPLPEIPAPQAAMSAATAPEPAPEAAITPEPTPAREPTATPTATAAPAPAAAADTASRPSGRSAPPPPPPGRPSSRVGGGVLLVIAIIAAVIIIIVATTGGSSPKKSGSTNPGTTPATTTTGTGTTTTTAATPHVIAQIRLRPTSRSSKALGAADIVTEGKVTGVIVRAIHLTPNTTHDAYAVWLSNPGGPSHLLGYVSPAVGKGGALSTSGPLPANAASYTELLITLETTAHTKTPGPPVLQGALSLG